MLELLSKFDTSQILIFAVLLICAVKGGWDLIEYFKGKYTAKFNKDYENKKSKEILAEHYEKCSNQHVESVQKYGELGNKIDQLSTNMEQRFADIDERFNALEKSDMHQIKHDIVKDYHYFVDEKGWIDDFNLNCLELMFEDYKREGGNSYIEGLMQELRQLPKHP